MRIYTKSGDKGSTSLIYGERVKKDDARVEAYGTCDEANSMIGLAMSQLKASSFNDTAFYSILHKIQTGLFHVGSELATPTGKDVKWKLTIQDITELEEAIDQWEEQLNPLKQFILPGGSVPGASLHVARTIVRRAERCAIHIEETVNPLVIQYLNRLSDLLFVAARYVNMQLNEKEQGLHESK